MSTSAVVPGPRSSLDEGTLHDLCVDCAQVVLPPSQPVAERRGRSADAATDAAAVDVPEGARHLIDELGAYGT